MPFKKSKVPAWKRKGAGKKVVRRRRAYKTVNLVGRSLNPIPQRMIVKHKYATSVSVAAGGGALASYIFNLNSMWDPDRTGTGHQPYGRDTYATLYNRYRVISCSYRVACIPSTPARVIQIAALPSNIAPGVTSMFEVREQPRCKYVLQQPGAAQKILSGKVYIPSLVGRTKAQYMADDNYQAQIGSSPSELALLNLYAGAITDDTTTDTFYFNVELEMTCEWFDVNPLPSS